MARPLNWPDWISFDFTNPNGVLTWRAKNIKEKTPDAVKRDVDRFTLLLNIRMNEFLKRWFDDHKSEDFRHPGTQMTLQTGVMDTMDELCEEFLRTSKTVAA